WGLAPLFSEPPGSAAWASLEELGKEEVTDARNRTHCRDHGNRRNNRTDGAAVSDADRTRGAAQRSAVCADPRRTGPGRARGEAVKRAPDAPGRARRRSPASSPDVL